MFAGFFLSNYNANSSPLLADINTHYDTARVALRVLTWNSRHAVTLWRRSCMGRYVDTADASKLPFRIKSLNHAKVPIRGSGHRMSHPHVRRD
jgi:hypothetical protein